MSKHRICAGCNGSGETMTDFRDGRYECSLACEVCNGSGSVEAKPSVRDAVADAETLKESYNIAWDATGSYAADAEAWGLMIVDFLQLAPAAIIHKYDTNEVYRLTTGETARVAARAAFRAVPGLRGE